MHDHDVNLVTDLTAGEDDGRGADLVASCAECASEYREQVAIKTALAQLPSITMRTEERSALRVGVNAELDRGARVLAFPTRWARLGTVAAAMLVVVGVGGVALNWEGLSGSGGDPAIAQLDLASESAAATTAAAADGAYTSLAPSAGRLVPAPVDLGEVTEIEFADSLTETRENIGAAQETTELAEKQPVPCAEYVEGEPDRVVRAVVGGQEVIGFVVENTPIAFYVDTCEPYLLD